jgi:tetratricopeptide (TPR) repeat protein
MQLGYRQFRQRIRRNIGLSKLVNPHSTQLLVTALDRRHVGQYSVAVLRHLAGVVAHTNGDVNVDDRPRIRAIDSLRYMESIVPTTIRNLSAVALLSVAAATSAMASEVQLTAANERYGAGDLDGAREQLEPLLAADGLDQLTRQRARELAARVLQSRGEEHFRQARISNAIADFDRQIKLQPDQEAGHWQRGIAYYYAGEYEKSARQFELHQTVNPQDVENAAWHFLCVVRTPHATIETARKNLIPVTRDSRTPMAQIQQLFAGNVTPEAVLRAGEDAGGAAKFYAHLYVGLYYEALKRNDESLRLISSAADNPAARKSYMGDVARVHVTLRKQTASSNQVSGAEVSK